MGTSMMGKGMDPQDLTWFKQARKRMNRGMVPNGTNTPMREENRMGMSRSGVSRETTKAPKGPSVFMRMSNGV